MNGYVQLTLEMNAYLFGCLVLLAFWIAVLYILKRKRRFQDIRELWWASFACSLLGVTEPLFVPDYWDPPSILKVWRWDFESFLFCFGVGGLAAVFTEFPRIRRVLLWIDFQFFRMVRGLLTGLSWITREALPLNRVSGIFSSALISKEQRRMDNMILVLAFTAMFGATSQLNLNIIYDSAIVCVTTAGFIWWRRPKLRWQIFGGGLSFTLIYTVVLVAVGWVYPDFYDHWNRDELSGFEFLGAPIEEYLFSFTFGVFWAPLYEAWREEPRASGL
jgi:phosphotransferase system  glucose/maltose/N-acetylglucosamine-specific IIC component